MTLPFLDMGMVVASLLLIYFSAILCVLCLSVINNLSLWLLLDLLLLIVLLIDCGGGRGVDHVRVFILTPATAAHAPPLLLLLLLGQRLRRATVLWGASRRRWVVVGHCRDLAIPLLL